MDIRIAQTPEQITEATELLNRLYGERGFGNNHLIAGHTTFNAYIGDKIVGTITLEVAEEGCELTRFAFDDAYHSRETLAKLFHAVLLCDPGGCSNLYIECRPRHAAFYKKLLKFEQVGETYYRGEVNSPTQRLCLEVSKIREYIKSPPKRTLYEYF
jgi:hypothetical protein